ncbi:MAG: 4'-phosphopantetheinyl transferase superfamily protein [Ruminococcus sp.]|nr:4'-phosphopantetheinyl transferase superfamily protein [Ruminococcus sp.]
MSVSPEYRYYTEKDIATAEGLKENAVQIWILNLYACEKTFLSEVFLLSPCERAYAFRFAHRIDTVRSAVPRIFLHKIIARYLDISAQEVIIAKTEKGQPYVVNAPEVRISISHSGAYAVIALVLHRRIGIDIEQEKSIPEYLHIAKQYFCAEEYQAILYAQSQNLFFRYWTAKEAFLKAQGIGLYRSLDSFYVNLSQQVIEDDSVQWQLQPLQLEQYYISCIFEKMTLRREYETVSNI